MTPVVPLVAAVALGLAQYAAAQSVGANGCLSLSSSSMCPRYRGLAVNVTSLREAWPFFRQVNSTASFDAQFADYLSPDGQFAATKIGQQLGCSNYASGSVVQWSRTFLCGEFTTLSYSRGCNANLNLNNSMTCQRTCYEFASSELNLVNSTSVCPGAATSGTREDTLTKDFTQCTDWTTLASNDTATCVEGSTNEPNCGFGTASTTQLCSYCNPANGALVSPCCVRANTDISSCGYSLSASNILSTPAIGPTSAPSQPTGTAPVPSETPTTAAGTGSTGSQSSGGGLSGGAIAGIVVGAIVAAILILALCFLYSRRRRAREATENQRFVPDMNEKGSPNAHTPSTTAYASSPDFGLEKEKLKSNVDMPGSGIGGKEAAAVGLGAAGVGAAAGAFADPADKRFSGTTQSSSNEGRNLVASYRDSYSGTIIVPGSIVVAMYAYSPTLADELKLDPNDLVRVVKIFDDDWALGVVEDGAGGGRRGCFPLVVVTSQDALGSSSESGGDTTSVTSGQYVTGSAHDTEEQASNYSSEASLTAPIPPRNQHST